MFHPGRKAVLSSKKRLKARQHRLESAFLSLALVLVVTALIGFPSPVRGSTAVPQVTPKKSNPAAVTETSIPAFADLEPILKDVQQAKVVRDRVLSGGLVLRSLRNEGRSFSAGERLRLFSADVDLRSLARAVQLQGEKATFEMLSKAGMKEAGEALCGATTGKDGLHVASALLDDQAGMKEDFIHRESNKIYRQQPLELRSELLKASIRAQATYCLLQYFRSENLFAASSTL